MQETPPQHLALRAADPQAAVDQLSAAVAADANVLEVGEARFNEAGDTAVVQVIPRTGPSDELLAVTVLFAELGYLRCRIDLVGAAEEGLRAAGVLPDPGSPTLRPDAAEALYFVAGACWQRGELERAAVLGRALVERGAPGFGHEVLANVHSFRGDLDAARRAGTKQAASAMAHKTRGTATNVNGSSVPTP